MSKIVNIRMSRPGSPHMIEILTDPDDSHFCNVIQRRAKTGEAVCSHYILTSDVSTWISKYEAKGFAETIELKR